MKRILPLALLVLATSAHAKEILLSCEVSFGSGMEPTRIAYRIFDEGTKVQLGAYGQVVQAHTTISQYTWTWSATIKGTTMEFRDVIDRHSGTLAVYNNNEQVASGSCELTKPKF